jgi:hypothetical protein
MSSVDTPADEAGAAEEQPAEEQPAEERSPNGPNPFVVVGAALAVGVVLARWIDWRGHGRSRR